MTYTPVYGVNIV